MHVCMLTSMHVGTWMPYAQRDAQLPEALTSRLCLHSFMDTNRITAVDVGTFDGLSSLREL